MAFTRAIERSINEITSLKPYAENKKLLKELETAANNYYNAKKGKTDKKGKTRADEAKGLCENWIEKLDAERKIFECDLYTKDFETFKNSGDNIIEVGIEGIGKRLGKSFGNTESEYVREHILSFLENYGCGSGERRKACASVSDGILFGPD